MSQQQADDSRAPRQLAIAAVATRKAELSAARVLRGYQQIVAPVRRRDHASRDRSRRARRDPRATGGRRSSRSPRSTRSASSSTCRTPTRRREARRSRRRSSRRATPRRSIGKIARTSGVLEQATRTLRAEIHVRGRGPLLPGSFVYVRLVVPRARPAPVIPASALVVRKEGTLVAKVENGDLALVGSRSAATSARRSRFSMA